MVALNLEYDASFQNLRWILPHNRLYHFRLCLIPTSWYTRFAASPDSPSTSQVATKLTASPDLSRIWFASAINLCRRACYQRLNFIFSAMKSPRVSICWIWKILDEIGLIPMLTYPLILMQRSCQWYLRHSFCMLTCTMLVIYSYKP